MNRYFKHVVLKHSNLREDGSLYFKFNYLSFSKKALVYRAPESGDQDQKHSSSVSYVRL